MPLGLEIDELVRDNPGPQNGATRDLGLLRCNSLSGLRRGLVLVLVSEGNVTTLTGFAEAALLCNDWVSDRRLSSTNTCRRLCRGLSTI